MNRRRDNNMLRTKFLHFLEILSLSNCEIVNSETFVKWKKIIVIKYILRNKLWKMGSLLKLMIVLILIFCPNWCIIVKCGKIFINRGDVIPMDWIMLCIQSSCHCSWQTTYIYMSSIRIMVKYEELFTHSPVPTDKAKQSITFAQCD